MTAFIKTMHSATDALLASFLRHHETKLPSEVGVLELLEWNRERLPSESGADVFNLACHFLDTLKRPYVFVLLDVDCAENTAIPAGSYGSYWRSTLSREGTIEGLWGLANHLEQNPGELSGVEGMS